ncbi:MAG: protein of unknown function MetA and HslJ [Spirosoma sp.]|nr:protein of unknown function MetA and HslJ [Spirosoma sp.]
MTGMMGFSRVCCVVITLVIVGTGCRRSVSNVPSASNRSSGKVAGDLSLTEKRQQGIDFVAVGSNPADRSPAGWHLDIDFSKQMRFEAPNGISLQMAVPKPKPSPKGMGVVLDAQSGPLLASINRHKETSHRNRLMVSIEPVTYHDPLTKRDYAYTARIETNGRQYVGGGVFLKSSDRLPGNWTLETFKGQRLRPNQFGDNALPVLTIDLKEGKLTGSTGWSKLKGDIRASGNQLSVNLKPMNQSSSSFLEANFLEALRQSSLFRIGKDRLTLLVNGQYVMTLRRS